MCDICQNINLDIILKKEFEVIMNNLWQIDKRYKLYKCLKSGVCYEVTYLKIPYTMRVILDSLFDNVFLNNVLII